MYLPVHSSSITTPPPPNLASTQTFFFFFFFEIHHFSGAYPMVELTIYMSVSGWSISYNTNLYLPFNSFFFTTSHRFFASYTGRSMIHGFTPVCRQLQHLQTILLGLICELPMKAPLPRKDTMLNPGRDLLVANKDKYAGKKIHVISIHSLKRSCTAN
jgi:hypothetical protein